MNKNVLKLSKLLKHWANHNESHKESYIKWLNYAKNNGLNSVAQNLSKAIEMMDKSTDFLLIAHKELESITY